MPTILGSRRDGDGNVTAFFDTVTQETTARFLPIILDEDFLGPGHSTIPVAGSPATAYPWVQKTVKTAGAPSVSILTNAAGGVVALALSATSELQEASLYANDMLNWDPSKGLTYEDRMAMAVLPTVNTEAVWGLQSAWVNGPDNATYYLRFQATAAGIVNMQLNDGVSVRSFPTAVTLAAGAFHIYRIDASDPTNVIFAIDGVIYSAAVNTSFAGAGSMFQPYCSVYKASGAGVGTMQMDSIQVGANRV